MSGACGHLHLPCAVFATEYKDVVDSGNEEVAGFGGDEAAGFGDDFPAVDDGEPREVYDEGEAAGFGGTKLPGL